MSTDSINVAVIGAGAFGRNHARVYHELQQSGAPVRLTAIVDTDAARGSALAKLYPGAEAVSSLQELLRRGGFQAASVAVPTVEHVKVATALLEAGVDVLIEKPLASTLGEADELIQVAQRTRRIAQVGHLERFNPAIRATIPLLTRPMFFEVHRLSVFSPRSLDVDVVLDLMIHDLDVVLSFANSPIKEIRAVGLPVISGKVDIANVRMEFESGCVANFTASRVSTERVRKLRFFQPKQYISIDYTRQDVVVFTVPGEPDAMAAMRAIQQDTPGTGPSGQSPIYGSQIQITKPPITGEEPLKAELRSFLHAVRSRTKPVIPLEDGRRALAAALDVLATIREHNQRTKLDALHAMRP
ncbi:MAG TPA: Gfo/Idh/MocA family oxidoreductase [Terriglobales bacterium]|nr:Gfo/Idh/MocA family oxidoreductase [Terriglobales bacterium]